MTVYDIADRLPECINQVVAQNSSVARLASLPLGHVAYRENPGRPWVIEPHVWPEE